MPLLKFAVFIEVGFFFSTINFELMTQASRTFSEFSRCVLQCTDTEREVTALTGSGGWQGRLLLHKTLMQSDELLMNLCLLHPTVNPLDPESEAGESSPFCASRNAQVFAWLHRIVLWQTFNINCLTSLNNSLQREPTTPVCDFPVFVSFDLVNSLNTHVPFGSTGPQERQKAQSRARASLAVVLVFAGVSTLMAAGYFLYKKSPIPLISKPTFENPLYFDGEPSQPDVVDTNKMIAKEEENTEQFITLWFSAQEVLRPGRSQSGMADFSLKLLRVYCVFFFFARYTQYVFCNLTSFDIVVSMEVAAAALVEQKHFSLEDDSVGTSPFFYHLWSPVHSWHPLMLTRCCWLLVKRIFAILLSIK